MCIRDRDWDGAELTIEHCDHHRPDGSYEKGFLSLDQELEIINDFNGLMDGIVLNWGRSVIEGRSVDTILDHISICQRQKKLTGFIFSGTSIEDKHYGSWEDQHMPFFISSSKVNGLENSLLNEEKVKLTIQKLNLKD